MLKSISTCLLFLGWAAVACQPSVPAWPTTDSTVESAVLTQMATQPRPTLFPAMDETVPPVSTDLSGGPEIITPPPPDQIPTGAARLAGLVFDAGNLVQVGQDGSLITLYDRPVDILSADVKYTLTSGNGDYWMYDLQARSLVKLTDTANRQECCAVWWKEHPDKILMLSNSAGTSTGVATRGYLTVIRMDGSGYRVLDTEHQTTGTPAVSPDGIWIAYGIGETGWLFGAEQEPVPLDPRDFGLESLKGQRISHPSWSPDGTKIAWYWQSTLNVGYRGGVVVFDLVNKTYQLSSLVEPASDEMPAQSPIWSGDGRWLAYLLEAKQPEDSGVWIMRTDGQGNPVVHVAGMGFLPGAWSPDGGSLAVVSTPESTLKTGLWLVDASTWKLTPVDLPGVTPGRVFLWQE